MASARDVARATIMALPKQGFEPGRPGPLEGVRVLDFSRLVAGNMLSLQLQARRGDSRARASRGRDRAQEGGGARPSPLSLPPGADMLLVGSENAGVGFGDGIRVLRAGGRALDAVEAAIRRVESNPADHRVGRGGPELVWGRDTIAVFRASGDRAGK